MRKRCKRRPVSMGRAMMATQPWKVASVFSPIERVLHRMLADGEIDCTQGRPVFKEESQGGWYEVASAIRGVIQFHEIIEQRHGFVAHVDGLIRLANKLDYGTPIFEEDIARVYADIEVCKRQALRLTIDEATDVVQCVRISAELDKIKPSSAATSERAAGTAQGDGALNSRRAA